MASINNKILEISNHKFEKFGFCALAPKAYISKDETLRLYTKANSLLINGLPNYFRYAKQNEVSDYIANLDKANSNEEVRVSAPLSIKSLLGKVVIATLWDGNSWHELICKTVDVPEHSQENVTVCLYPDLTSQTTLSDEVNNFTIKNLHLNSYLKEIPHEYDRKPYYVSYQRFVQFPADLLYSVEVKGETEIRIIDLPPKRFTYEGEHSWSLNDILFSQIQLTIDYDAKRIFGNYINEELFGGRRNSNGWINRYLVNRAYYWKNFELIFDINRFIDELSKSLKAIDGTAAIYKNYKNTESTIEITFNKSISFEQINEVLQFNVNGSMYTYYESDY